MLKYILNKELVDAANAYIHVSDLALLRGYGIFDFFRLEGMTPLFIEKHLDRFFNSAHVLRLDCPVTKIELRNQIFEMISANRLSNSGIRMVLTGGESKNGYDIGAPTLFVINEPINPLPEDHFTKGIKILTCEYIRDLPHVKTINYIMGIYNLPETRASGSVDILYHWRGIISELTRSNIFIVNKEGAIITPGKEILMGITRKHVLDLAKKQFKIEERQVHLDEVYAAEEAFITGTTKKVMPVIQVNDHFIGNGKPGPITQKLQKALDFYIDRYVTDSSASTK